MTDDFVEIVCHLDTSKGGHTTAAHNSGLIKNIRGLFNSSRRQRNSSADEDERNCTEFSHPSPSRQYNA